MLKIRLINLINYKNKIDELEKKITEIGLY